MTTALSVRLKVKVPHTVIEPLRPEEVNSFLKTLSRYRDLSIVLLMLLCGLRSCEILSLNIVDVDVIELQVRVRGKGNKERVLPIPETIASTIRRYLKLEKPKASTTKLFCVLQGPRRGAPMTPSGLRKLFRYHRTACGVKRANAHRFRHTFGADMARSKVQLPVLQRMMGHADAGTTLQYIHLSMADIADEYRQAIQKIQSRYDSV